MLAGSSSCLLLGSVLVVIMVYLIEKLTLSLAMVGCWYGLSERVAITDSHHTLTCY